MLELRIENLGKLKSASFDVDKPLLVFCGPNNSGKTYAATVLFGLYEALTSPLKIISSVTLQNFAEQIEPIPILPFCKQHAASFYERLGQFLTENIPLLFGNRLNQMADYKIRFGAWNGDEDAMQRRRCFQHFPKVGKSTSMAPEYAEAEAMLSFGWAKNKNPHEHLGEVEHILEGMLKDYLVGFRRHHFFPAERNALNLFARDILLNRNEYLNRSLILTTEEMIPRAYAMPIQDHIRFMETIGKAGNYLNSSFADLARILESKALMGSVQVSPERDLEFHTEDGVVLDAGMTSSLVKSLSGLVFYFRHIGYERDILFIDEPEANLHPQVQRILARVLVSAVNRGMKVVISTHSDIILSELNNLIMLSQESEAARELAQKYQVEPEQVLPPEKLGVYVFGSETGANAVEVTEQGFDVASISSVIDGQAAAAQDIFYTLFE